MILLLDEEPDNSEESNNEGDNAGHISRTITTASPANPEFSSEESPPVDTKDMPSNGNNFLISKG